MSEPTPRTDAADKNARKIDGEDYWPGQMREHARKLERELNAWRKCARNLAEAYTSGDFQAMREFKELDGE